MPAIPGGEKVKNVYRNVSVDGRKELGDLLLVRLVSGVYGGELLLFQGSFAVLHVPTDDAKRHTENEQRQIKKRISEN